MKCSYGSHFESWNPSPDVEPGSPEYYSKQVYKHGARCWNGPERNVVVRLDPNSPPANTEITHYHPFTRLFSLVGLKTLLNQCRSLKSVNTSLQGRHRRYAYQ